MNKNIGLARMGTFRQHSHYWDNLVPRRMAFQSSRLHRMVTAAFVWDGLREFQSQSLVSVAAVEVFEDADDVFEHPQIRG
jgi:hypothetical protein